MSIPRMNFGSPRQDSSLHQRHGAGERVERARLEVEGVAVGAHRCRRGLQLAANGAVRRPPRAQRRVRGWSPWRRRPHAATAVERLVVAEERDAAARLSTMACAAADRAGERGDARRRSGARAPRALPTPAHDLCAELGVAVRGLPQTCAATLRSSRVDRGVGEAVDVRPRSCATSRPRIAARAPRFREGGDANCTPRPGGKAPPRQPLIARVSRRTDAPPPTPPVAPAAPPRRCSFFPTYGDSRKPRRHASSARAAARRSLEPLTPGGPV